MWFVLLVDVLWVLLCVWYLYVVYVKSNPNVHTKPKEYNYFDILVGGGGDLKLDQVPFLDDFIYRAGAAPMILCICALNVYYTLCNHIQNIKLSIISWNVK